MEKLFISPEIRKREKAIRVNHTNQSEFRQDIRFECHLGSDQDIDLSFRCPDIHIFRTPHALHSRSIGTENTGARKKLFHFMFDAFCPESDRPKSQVAAARATRERTRLIAAHTAAKCAFFGTDKNMRGFGTTKNILAIFTDGEGAHSPAMDIQERLLASRQCIPQSVNQRLRERGIVLSETRSSFA